jgi:hypothetical protein
MKWKICGRKWLWLNLRYYNVICLEGTTKKHKTYQVRVAGLQADNWIRDLQSMDSSLRNVEAHAFIRVFIKLRYGARDNIGMTCRISFWGRKTSYARHRWACEASALLLTQLLILRPSYPSAPSLQQCTPPSSLPYLHLSFFTSSSFSCFLLYLFFVSLSQNSSRISRLPLISWNSLLGFSTRKSFFICMLREFYELVNLVRTLT